MRRLAPIAAVTLLLVAGCSGGHAASSPTATPDEAKFLAEVRAAGAAAGFDFDPAEALRTGYSFCHAMVGVKIAGGTDAWIAASGLQDDPEVEAAVRAAGDLCPDQHLR